MVFVLQQARNYWLIIIVIITDLAADVIDDFIFVCSHVHCHT